MSYELLRSEMGLIMEQPADSRYQNFHKPGAPNPAMPLLVSVWVKAHYHLGSSWDNLQTDGWTHCWECVGLWVCSACLSKEFFSENVLSDLKGQTMQNDIFIQAISLFRIPATQGHPSTFHKYWMNAYCVSDTLQGHMVWTTPRTGQHL